MPRRGSEPALKPVGVFFLLLFSAATPAAAQDGAPFLLRDRTTVTVAASAKLTHTAGRAAGLAGGWFALRVTERLAFGGAGYDLVGRVPVTLPGERRDLAFGYGGLWIEVHPFAPTANASLSVLAGVGNADLYLHSTGRELRSDNFLVVEPQAAYALPLSGRLTIQVAAGYRRVLGVRGLTPLDDGDLSGATLTASLRAGPF